VKFETVFIKKIEDKTLTIKVGADGEPWRKVVMDFKDLRNKKFWKKLEQATKEAPINEFERSDHKCVICNSNKKSTFRGYKKWYFCGFCGAHYELVKGKMELICKR